MLQTSEYINILADATVIATAWKRDVGDRVVKPGTSKMISIKYSLTRVMYNQCLENRTELVKKYFLKKAEYVLQGRGFTTEVKMEVLKELFDEVKDEPLMQETFFISMNHFN